MLVRAMAVSACALLSVVSASAQSAGPRTAAIKPATEPAEPALTAPDPLTPPEVSGPPPAAPGAPAETAAPPAAGETDPVVLEVRRRAASLRPGSAGDRDDVAGLRAFYEAASKPVWTDAGGINPRGRLASEEIHKADDWGLRASAFELPGPVAGAADAAALADTELKLSLAVLRYARHARGGRIPDPTALTRLLDRKPRPFDPRSVLQAIAATEAADAYLRGLHPKHAQFHKLRQALVAERARVTGGRTAEPPAPAPAAEAAGTAAAAPSGPEIPSGPRIKPGQRHPHVALVRQRLSVAATGDDDTLLDDALAKALQAYQRLQRLQPTGVISNETRTALNGGPRRTQRAEVAARPAISSSETIQRLVVNMERWRWMPDDLGSFHVWANVPEQTTSVHKGDSVVFSERIVVGKPQTPTPSFSADMLLVIFHPSWGVPDGIKMNEIAPLLRSSSGGGGFFNLFSSGPTASHVLERVGGLRVSYNGQQVNPDSINWSSVDIRQFHFSQPPGPRNVLGQVKFRFPNKHDVYMHDTPERHLFGGAVRAFSHGCMRVQNPMRLAEVLLEHDKGWDGERVRSILTGRGGNPEVRLTQPIPVHTVYFTAVPDAEGKVRYLADLYAIDARVASALEGRQVHLATRADPIVAPERGAAPEREGATSGAGEAAAPPAARAAARTAATGDEPKQNRKVRQRKSASAEPAREPWNNPFSGLYGN